MKFSIVFEKTLIYFINLIEKSRQLPLPQIINKRLLISLITVSSIFFLISLRLLNVMLFYEKPKTFSHEDSLKKKYRANIVDRRGEILATQVKTASVYADPRLIKDPSFVCKKLKKILKNIQEDNLYKKLSSKKAFVWIKRHVTPKQQQEINYLGIPGIQLKSDARRVYPYSNISSHVVGYCDIDGFGLGGIERSFESELVTKSQPIKLSIDIRLQSKIRKILHDGIKEFKANGGNAIIMDVKTGELFSMVSLPDFNPNHPGKINQQSLFNRSTLGVNEPGSIFKIINAAIAFETKSSKIDTIYDATNAYKIGKFKIKDYMGKKRPLSVYEGFVYSSNIVSIKMALEFGKDAQQKYLKKLGFLSKPSFDIKEVGCPIVPKKYTNATMITASYGYGIAVSPLQSIGGIGAVINDGIYNNPTLIKRENLTEGKRVFSSDTSKKIRALMRMVVLKGSGNKAAIPGIEVFGKTGTAETVNGKKYSKNSRNTFFIGGFPYHQPKYILIVMLDNPKSTNRYGYTTAGWNVVHVAKKMLQTMSTFFHYVPEPEIKQKKRNDLIQTRYSFKK